MPKILVGYPAGKIGCCQFYIFLVSSVGRALGCKADRKIKEVSSSIRKLIDDKVAKSVKLVTSNVDDNTEQGESYV